MSEVENTQQQQETPTEIITKEEVKSATKPEKIKNPRKVAAGKELARKNKEASERAKAGKSEEVEGSWFELISGYHVLGGLISVGFGVYHGYRYFFPLKDEKVDKVVETNPNPKPETNAIDME